MYSEKIPWHSEKGRERFGYYGVALQGKLTETVFIGRFRKAFERVGEHEL